jgi:hypothetical protein
MIPTIWRLLFGVNVREYVDTHYGTFIRPNGWHFAPARDHVIYKCHNSKRPFEFWYECDFGDCNRKIHPDLYIHKKKIVAI